MSAEIIDSYSRPGDIICDPFVGSGTNLVEAATAGRSSYGLDIDPLSVFVARTKLTITPTVARLFTQFSERLLQELTIAQRRSSFYESAAASIDSRYKGSKTRATLSLGFRELVDGWFRPYVLDDLLAIRRAILSADVSDTLKHLALLAFANAIRPCSNADPAPVSGLEYTKRMRELDAKGRVINPFSVFRKKLVSLVRDAHSFAEQRKPGTHRVYHRDAAEPWRIALPANLITFSPPYLNAVEYSRRHKLEMAWLGLVEDRKQHVALSARYIGRRPGGTEPFERQPVVDPLLESIRTELLKVDYARARAFLVYCRKLSTVLIHAANTLADGGLCAIVIGRNRVSGLTIPMDELLPRIAAPLRHVHTNSYPLRDRYMSYERRNGADIGREYVVVLEKP